jgi:hypothetical protein
MRLCEQTRLDLDLSRAESILQIAKQDSYGILRKENRKK